MGCSEKLSGEKEERSMKISLKVLNDLLTEAYDDGYLRGCAEASDKNAAAVTKQYQTGIAGKANDNINVARDRVIVAKDPDPEYRR